MATSINISSCFENPQTALISAFRQRNLSAFKFALEQLGANPNLKDPKTDETIFESILLEPRSSDFINLCIDNGADLYSKHPNGKYPLHAAAESLCPENLATFLKSYDQQKINVRYNSDNSLNLLIGLLPHEREEKIAECIKLLLRHGCDPNMPNEKSRTPFCSLLRVQKRLKNPNDLVEFFVRNFAVDIYTYSRNGEMKKLFEKQNPGLDVPAMTEKVVNADYMMKLISDRNETVFENNFLRFKENSKAAQSNDDNSSNSFVENCSKFLFAAVVNNLEQVVGLLVSEGVDVNKLPPGKSSPQPAIFYAASAGFHTILATLLQAQPKPAIAFKDRNLLLEVCRNFGRESEQNHVDHQKCFYLMLDHCDVNATDKDGCSPLHYAVRYQNDEAVEALLKKSCYIGTKNNLGETAIDDLSSEVFEEFLNDCVACNVRRSDNDEQEITIDYNFLKAPKNPKAVSESYQEIEPLQSIADNSDLRPLILHPVLSSFILLKWNKLAWPFYINLAAFSCFMVSLILYIVMCQYIPADERSGNAWFTLSFVVSIIGIIILTLREIFQLVLSPKHYLISPVNWFEIALILFACIVLFQSSDDAVDDSTRRILRAVTILLAAYEFLQLVGTLPFLSVSTHMVILKKVAITFLKSIALYSILLLAFALSFYTLFGGKREAKDDDSTTVKPNDTDKASNCCNKDDDSDEFNSFGYPGIAIIKTFVMLTGEFDASALDLDRNGASYCIIFLLFVFLVTIVLFNLLNALAVDDTQAIKAEGQLVDLCQRIAVLSKYEKIILNRTGWEWLKRKISIFPHTVPHGKIVIRPNKSNEVLTFPSRPSSRDVSIRIENGQEQELETLNNNSSLEKIIAKREAVQLEKHSQMDPKIMKEIRRVLEERKIKTQQDAKDDKLMNRVKGLESQLKILTDAIMKMKSS